MRNDAGNRIDFGKEKQIGNRGQKGKQKCPNRIGFGQFSHKFLSTVQIGITLIGILTGIYSGDKITHDVQTFVEGFEMLKPFAPSLSVGMVVVVLTFFSLVLGELLPKRIGLNHPEGIAKAVALPMKIVSIITKTIYLVADYFDGVFIECFANQANCRRESNRGRNKSDYQGRNRRR